MKLCITMISNRPQMAKERWLSSVHKLDPLRAKIDTCFSFVFEEPFSAAEAVPYTALGATKIVKKRNAKRFNWWPDRNEVMKQSPADIYLMTDDDCRFGGPTTSGYTSWKRYHDAILYMEKNPSCGAVCMLPFLGGAPSGKKILIAEDDLFALGSGLLLRRLPDLDYSHKVFDIPGALDESGAVFSRIERGYYTAKTFNTPTFRPPTKKVEPGAKHPGYDDDYINTKGLGSVIRKRYDDPTWHHNARRIPHGCLASYHIQCKLRGFKPRYGEPNENSAAAAE